MDHNKIIIFIKKYILYFRKKYDKRKYFTTLWYKN